MEFGGVFFFFLKKKRACNVHVWAVGLSCGWSRWLKDFFSNGALLSRVLKCCFQHLISLVRRLVMGHKGWTKVEVPDGWLQVIRGPTPSSVRWPSKKPAEQPCRGADPSVRLDPVHSKKEPQRRCPTEVRAMGFSKVARIQAAIANLAVDDMEAALVRAQWQASVPPVNKRIADSMAFIKRAQKRVAAESAKILEAEKTRWLPGRIGAR